MKLALKAIKQSIDNRALPVVKRFSSVGLPEPRFLHDSCQYRLGAAKARSRHPRNHSSQGMISRSPFWVASLASFSVDLRGHTVEALRALFGTRKHEIGDGASDTAIAVIERMDGDEP